jgi:acyl-CoA oxidase
MYFFSFSEKYFFADPELNDPVPMDFLSHKEKYEEAVRKAYVVYKKLQEMRKATGKFDISRYNIHYIRL